MLNKTKFSGLVAAAVLAFSLVGPASAATITWSSGAVPGDNTDPTLSFGAVLIDQTATTAGIAVSPFDDETEFNSVGAGAAATYAFNSVRSTLKLIWGSVDDFNFIEFYNGADLKEIVGGASTGGPYTINRPISEILASIVVTGGFDRVVLRSIGKNAFEHASVAAVPVPAAGFLLIGALGGLAALRRRKAST